MNTRFFIIGLLMILWAGRTFGLSQPPTNLNQQRIEGTQSNYPLESQAEDMNDIKTYLYFQSGYPVALGYHYGLSPAFPSFILGIARGSEAKASLAPMEIGYFQLQSGQAKLNSILWHLGYRGLYSLSDCWRLESSFTFGWLFSWGSSGGNPDYSDLDKRSLGFSIKTGMGFAYKIAENFSFTMDNQFILGTNFRVGILIFIPNAGLRYQF